MSLSTWPYWILSPILRMKSLSDSVRSSVIGSVRRSAWVYVRDSVSNSVNNSIWGSVRVAVHSLEDYVENYIHAKFN